jgi:hypothetical protein
MQFRGITLEQHETLGLKCGSVMVTGEIELRLYLWPRTGSPKQHRAQAVVTYKATGETLSSKLERGSDEVQTLESALVGLWEKLAPTLSAIACKQCLGVRCTCDRRRLRVVEPAASAVASAG